MGVNERLSEGGGQSSNMGRQLLNEYLLLGH